MDLADPWMSRWPFEVIRVERAHPHSLSSDPVAGNAVHASPQARTEQMLWHRVTNSLPLRSSRAQQNRSSGFGFLAVSRNPLGGFLA